MSDEKPKYPHAGNYDDYLAIVRNARQHYRPFVDFDKWPALTPVMNDSWDRAIKSLADARAAASASDVARVAEGFARMAAVDTGAIEGLYHVDRGFTLSIGFGPMAWENLAREKGESTKALIESQRLALDMAFDVATKRTPVTESLIRQLHQTICLEQETYKVMTQLGEQERPLKRGEYKTEPNFPHRPDGRVHVYAPPEDVPAEMERLLAQTRTSQFEDAHPVCQASYLHYGLVSIHPFADGNGRVARCAASAYLYRAISLPLMIWSYQLSMYFSALESADEGKRVPFLKFVLDCAVEAAYFCSIQLRKPAGDMLEDAAAQLRALVGTPSGLSHAQLVELGTRIFSDAVESLVSRLRELFARDDIKVQVEQLGGVSHQRAGYRALDPGTKSATLLRLRSMHPVSPVEEVTFVPLASTEVGNTYDLLLIPSKPELPELQLRVAEVVPGMSGSYHARVNAWCDACAIKLIDRFGASLRRSLGDTGYLS